MIDLDALSAIKAGSDFWLSRSGAVAIVVCSVLLALAAEAAIRTSTPGAVFGLTVVLSISLGLGGWVYLRRMPRAKPGNIAAALAIHTSTPEEHDAVHQGLRRALERLAVLSGGDCRAQVIVIRPHHLRRIPEEAMRAQILSKTGSAMVVFGDCVVGLDDGVLRLNFNFRSVVSCTFRAVIEDRVREILTGDMNDLLPGRISFPSSHSGRLLEALSMTLAAFAAHILGCRACLEGRPSDAVELLEYAKLTAEAARVGGVSDKLVERAKQRIGQAYGVIRLGAYHEWLRTGSVESERRYLDAFASERFTLSGDALKIAEAVACFFDGRNVRAARAASRRISNKNPARSANLAFLCAFRGDLDGAFRHYKDLRGLNSPGLNVVEISSFVAQAADVSGIPELYFASGYVDRFITGDQEVATGAFGKYLELREMAGERFGKYERLARLWGGSAEATAGGVEATPV